MAGYPQGAFYGRTFQPVVTENQNVLFTPREQVAREERRGTIRRVIYIEPLPSITIDLFTSAGITTLAAAASQSDIQVTEIEMDDDEFAQWRFHPLDDIEIQLKQPLGKTRWKTRSSIARIDANVLVWNPTLSTSEFFEYEDTRVNFNLFNPGASAIAKARLKFYGYRYVLDQRHFKPKQLIEELANAAYDSIAGAGRTRESDAAYRYKQLLEASRDDGMVLNAMLRDGYVKAIALPTEGIG